MFGAYWLLEQNANSEISGILPIWTGGIAICLLLLLIFNLTLAKQFKKSTNAGNSDS